MILLAGFLDVMFRALVFIGLALSIGGIVFHYIVSRPLEASGAVGDTMPRRTASLIAAGAFLVGLSQIVTMLASASALASGTGNLPIATFLGTSFARAGMLHAALGLCLGCAAIVLRRHPRSSSAWGLAAFIGALLMVSGAWLTHGASRLENREALMAVTVLHQFAAFAWIGGTMHLTAQWQLLRRSHRGEELWPRLLARFSPLALTSVALLVGAGLYLYWEYIRGIRGLLGTAYGTMLITKLALMGSVLLLGGINNLTIRHWKLTGEKEELARRVPVFAGTEAVIGATILMAAAALTGQPPAVDVPNLQASPAEVIWVFAPKIPRLTPMPLARLNAGAGSSLDPYALPTEMQKLQSDFNHNISGICVILIGLGAFLNRLSGKRRARHWPLLFLPLAAFLLIFGEPTGWPLGKEGFLATLTAPDVLQHRLATLSVIIFSLFEWRIQTSDSTSNWGRYVFPLLCIGGGALLLTHTHSIFPLKSVFLIEVSHDAIGVLGVLIGAAGWLELRMPGREGRVAGLLWPIFFMLVGVVLLFYQEK